MSVSQGSKKHVRKFSFIGGTKDCSEVKPLVHISRATLNSSTPSRKAGWGSEEAQFTSQAARAVIFLKFIFPLYLCLSFLKSSRALSSNKSLHQTETSGAARVEVGDGDKTMHPSSQPASPSPGVSPQQPPSLVAPEHF